MYCRKQLLQYKYNRQPHNGTALQGTEGRWMRPGQPDLPPQDIFSVEWERSWRDKNSTTANTEGRDEDRSCGFYMTKTVWIVPGVRGHQRPESNIRARDQKNNLTKMMSSQNTETKGNNFITSPLFSMYSLINCFSVSFESWTQKKFFDESTTKCPEKVLNWYIIFQGPMWHHHFALFFLSTVYM